MFSPQSDYELVSPPSDSISSVSFSPKANFLAATSWDNQVKYTFLNGTLNSIVLFVYLKLLDQGLGGCESKQNISSEITTTG